MNTGAERQPHNSPWRRFARRYAPLRERAAYLAVLGSIWLAGWVWLAATPEWRWAADLLRKFAVLLLGVIVFLSIASQASSRSEDAGPLPPEPDSGRVTPGERDTARFWDGAWSVALLLTALLLAFREVQAAVLVYTGMAVADQVRSVVRCRTSGPAWLAAGLLAGAAAFSAGSAPLFAWSYFLVVPSAFSRGCRLSEVVRRKMFQDRYVGYRMKIAREMEQRLADLLFRHGVAPDPSAHAQFHLALAALVGAERWDEALEEVERLRVRALMTGDEETTWRARIYAGQERFEEIVRMADEEGRDPELFLTSLAVACARTGHFVRALRLAEDAVEKKRAGAALALGEVYAAMGNEYRALRWFEKAAQASDSSEHGTALRRAAEMLILLGDYREAAVALERAIREGAYLRLEDVRRLAECLRACGETARAEELEALARGREAAGEVPEEPGDASGEAAGAGTGSADVPGAVGDDLDE